MKDTNKSLDNFEKKLDETDSRIHEIHQLPMGKRTPVKNKLKPVSDGRVSDDDDCENESEMNQDDDVEYDGVFIDDKFLAAARDFLSAFLVFCQS